MDLHSNFCNPLYGLAKKPSGILWNSTAGICTGYRPSVYYAVSFADNENTLLS